METPTQDDYKMSILPCLLASLTSGTVFQRDYQQLNFVPAPCALVFDEAELHNVFLLG
jgi:hypothetical protein